MYIKEKVIDFSYKEDFFIINKDIKTINDYLKKLSKDKDSIQNIIFIKLKNKLCSKK